jgi:hypothetical protein
LLRPEQLKLNHTKQSHLHEKGNVDQRVATGGMPDRDR